MQTAVEFIVEKLNKLETEKHLYKVIDYRVKKQIIIEEAKQMFEQQIIDTYKEGHYHLVQDSFNPQNYFDITFKTK